MNIIYTILAVIIGILEFLGFASLLKYILTQLSNHNITLLSCLSFIVFFLWLGNKINKMSQPVQEDTDER